MKRISISVWLVVLLIILGASNARAEMYPRTKIIDLMEKAELIVEGEYQGDDIVKVTQVIKASKNLPKKVETIRVIELNKHSRMLRDSLDGVEIKTKKVILFLRFDRKKTAWESLQTLEGGSLGAFWFDDKTCYGYDQLCNPCPYELVAGTDSRSRFGYMFPESRIPKDIASLRRQIASVAQYRDEWKKTLEIKDPEQRMRALARYLLQSTSPENWETDYCNWAFGELASFGSKVVPLLKELLESAKKGDDTTYLVRLIKRLDQEEK